MAGPLDGVKVIEIDSWMAAPSTGAILADMGADVIKVEPLSGDPMRKNSRPAKLPDDIKDFDFQFNVDNRGKRSIAVALDTQEGADLVRRLVSTAQVFMCNLLAQRQERFGLDPATLLAINPSLVHATLTGYGTDGPDAWRPGYDVTAFFGRSGIYDAMREGEDGTVPMARPAQGDHTTGLAMSTAILGALRLAERTGEGQAVETSLYEAAVWTQATDYAITAMDRAPLKPRARENLIIATANRYPCGDGRWIVMNMPEEWAWPKLCRIIGREDWIDDERLQDLRGRFRNMPEIVAGIDEALSAKTRDEWGEIFDAEGVIWGPVLGLHEVAMDPQAEAIGLFPTIHSPEIGDFRSVRIPMRFHNADVGPRGPAPEIGDHTAVVLGEAGLTEDEIATLIEQGAVKQRTQTTTED
ncbi:MAG: crotonobetainyl-CoA:carnitine CoA-transferase CaiB-like acyl-CoA transferase [Candidatus Poriferisodalaceae bacterium]